MTLRFRVACCPHRGPHERQAGPEAERMWGDKSGSGGKRRWPWPGCEVDQGPRAGSLQIPQAPPLWGQAWDSHGGRPPTWLLQAAASRSGTRPLAGGRRPLTQEGAEPPREPAPGQRSPGSGESSRDSACAARGKRAVPHHPCPHSSGFCLSSPGTGTPQAEEPERRCTGAPPSTAGRHFPGFPTPGGHGGACGPSGQKQVAAGCPRPTKFTSGSTPQRGERAGAGAVLVCFVIARAPSMCASVGVCVCVHVCTGTIRVRCVCARVCGCMCVSCSRVHGPCVVCTHVHACTLCLLCASRGLCV